VPLPDEYDRISKDLLPYFAISPADLRERIHAATKLPDTYTLKVRKGSVRTTMSYNRQAIFGADERMAGQIDLLKPIAQYLGDFEAVYSVHDTPTNMVGWDHQRELLEHVDEDECESNIG
jgi:hypothetical protein